jgi:hypothetical protein
MTQSESTDCKLMDHVASAMTGDPLTGILATTFELQPDWLETDYLPTLFALGAWDDRAHASRVALERRLAEVQSATLFQATDHFRGRPRSLRLEVVPVGRPGLGVLHAKVSLIVHESSIRLIVGSANLTENGYRRNREVAVSLSASARKPLQASLIRACLQPMPALFERWWTPGAQRLVSEALESLQEWAPGTSANADEWFAWGGGEEPLWRSFLARWPKDEQVERISIVSPFWSENPANGPIEVLLQRLRGSGSLADGANLRLLTEARPDTLGKVIPVLPPAYRALDLSTMGVHAAAQAVDPYASREETGGVDDARPRPLHAKVVLLEGRRISLAYFGSANFTRRGWAIGIQPQAANIEAGLIVRRNGKARETLTALIPPTAGPIVRLDGAAASRLAIPEPDVPVRPWPWFIRHVMLVASTTQPGSQDLEVLADADAVEGPWSLTLDGVEGTEDLLLNGHQQAPQASGTWRIELTPDWHGRLLRSQHVSVRWWASTEAVAFPINVADDARDELPLMPGSGLPGEHELLQYYQSRIAFEELFPPLDSSLVDDPTDGSSREANSSAVDTARIQSYQIREFVEALRGIQADLMRAVGTPAAMRMALLGSVSPVALASSVMEAVQRGTRTPTAAAFQMVEILACLAAARANDVPERHQEAWDELLGDAVSRIEAHLASLRESYPTSFGKRASFTRYEKTIRELNALEVTAR